MGRKLTMLATVVVMPGGLLLLLSVAFVIALMRTSRGKQLLAPLGRRIPPRLRAQGRRVFAALVGEKLFLGPPSPVHTT